MNVRSINENSNQIQFRDKIRLPENMVAVDVGMDDYYIAICEKKEDVFLFTCGLGPCIAAAAHCKLNDGRIILGLAHMYNTLESCDLQGISPLSEQANNIIQQGYQSNSLDQSELNETMPYFKPYKLSKLIETIKSNCDKEVIDIYFGGGRGYYPVIHQLYREFALNHKELRLCDTAFDPYKITNHDIQTRFNTEIMSTISTTFGITTTGQAILAKRMNICDLSGLKDSMDFINYCESKKIVFPPNKDLVFGFETLTWKYLHREDFEYNYDETKKVISKKKLLQYGPTLFSSSTYQNSTPETMSSWSHNKNKL